MAQTVALIAALKQTLKEQGKTYADLAEGIDLSEASIKRLFSEQSFTLKRLDQICEWLGIEFGELVTRAESSLATISELTREQEKELASDTQLLLVTMLVTNRWQFDEILEHFKISKTELIRKLAKLDKLKLIQLLPNNRVKLLTARNFAWRKDGPVQNFFYKNVQSEYFKSRFDGPDESMRYLVGMLSEKSKERMLKQLNRLAREFEDLNREDAKLPLEQRRGFSLVLAMKPWDLPIFDQFKK